MIALHGNWVDLIILIFLAIYAWEGTNRGFLALLAEMVSFIASFLLALHLYPFATKFLIDNFSLSRGFSNALGFITLALLAEVTIATLLNNFFKHLPKEIFLSRLNRGLGFLPALIDGLILTAFILTTIVSLPVSATLKSDILSSRLGNYLISQTRDLEKSLNQVFGGAVQESLNFLSINPGSTQTIDLHFKTSDLTTDQASEQTMFDLINQERTSRGLLKLRLEPRLRDLARSHSKDMFVAGYFSHVSPQGKDPFQRMHDAGISYSSAGENLAYAPNVQIAHEGLMDSANHRANILNPDFGHIGIGVIDAGIYGKMFTQEFTD